MQLWEWIKKGLALRKKKQKTTPQDKWPNMPGEAGALSIVKQRVGKGRNQSCSQPVLWTTYQLPARDRSLDHRNLYTGSPHFYWLRHMSDPRAAVEILPLYPHFTEVEKRKSSSCWGRTQVAPNTCCTWRSFSHYTIYLWLCVRGSITITTLWLLLHYPKGIVLHYPDIPKGIMQ